MFREQLRELKPFEVEPIKESRAAAGQAKVKETALRVTKESSIEFTQKVLNLYIEER